METFNLPGGAAALGKVPSGIFVVGVARDGKRHAMLASWVMQAAMEPLHFSFAVGIKRHLHSLCLAGSFVALNILGAEDKELMARFGKPSPEGVDPFANADVLQNDATAGQPVLAGCLGYVIGEIVGGVDCGDHRVIVARVVTGELFRTGPPMIHVRNTARHY